MTVDLSLDIYPFSDQLDNEIGTNQNIADLVAASGLNMVAGYRDELFGYPQFHPASVRERTPEFHVGEFRIPVVTQMFVLRKKPYCLRHRRQTGAGIRWSSRRDPGPPT